MRCDYPVNHDLLFSAKNGAFRDGTTNPCPDEIATLLADNILGETADVVSSAGGSPTTFSGRQGTYLVNTNTLADLKDLHVDGYGAWGRKTYRGAFYYDIDDGRTTVTRIKQSWREVISKKVPDKYHFAVKFERYSNASSGLSVTKLELGCYECASYCPTYTSFRKTICEHLIAVSFQQNDLFELIEKTNEKLDRGMASKTLQSVTNGANAGRKGGGRRGINPSTGPTNITQTVTPQPSTTQTFSSVEKPTNLQRGRLMERRSATYTAPYHNDNRFVIEKAASFFRQHPGKNRQCVQCQVMIPKSDAGVGDDLVLSHDESFAFPDRKNPPAFMWSTHTTRSAVIHARYGCVTKRYPYFHRGLIDFAPSLELTTSHYRYLFQQFGYEKE